MKLFINRSGDYIINELLNKINFIVLIYSLDIISCF